VKYSISWTENALASLADSIAYLAQRSPEGAKRVVDRIDERVAALAQLPRTGRPYPKVSDANIRQVVVAPYIVVYRVNDDDHRVEVLMVRHSRRKRPDADELE